MAFRYLPTIVISLQLCIIYIKRPKPICCHLVVISLQLYIIYITLSITFCISITYYLC